MVHAGAALGQHAQPLLVDLHLSRVVEEGRHHRGPDVVGRVVAAGELLVVLHARVVDEEQDAAGRYRREQSALGRAVRSAEQGSGNEASQAMRTTVSTVPGGVVASLRSRAHPAAQELLDRVWAPPLARPDP